MNHLKSFFQARSMSWGPLEMLIMRVAFSCVILLTGIIWNAAQLPDPSGPLKDPNGLAKILPLGWLANPAVLTAGKPVVAVSLALYAVGLVPVLTLLPALVFMLGTGALRNSMGDISHHTQIVAMVLLGQWLVYLTSGVRRKTWWRADQTLQQQVIFWSILVIAATYVASGLMKLMASDLQWIQRVPGLSVQVIKAVWSESYSTGVPVSGFKAETVPALIVQYPNLARIFFGTGLILELAACCMVLSRRHALGIGLGLIAMHIGISLVMEIEFWNQMLLLLIFAVNLPGWFRSRGNSPVGGQGRESTLENPAASTDPGR